MSLLFRVRGVLIGVIYVVGGGKKQVLGIKIRPRRPRHTMPWLFVPKLYENASRSSLPCNASHRLSARV